MLPQYDAPSMENSASPSPHDPRAYSWNATSASSRSFTTVSLRGRQVPTPEHICSPAQSLCRTHSTTRCMHTPSQVPPSGHSASCAQAA